MVSILNDWTLPPLDLWVIYPSGRLTSTKARAFVKWFEGNHRLGCCRDRSRPSRQEVFVAKTHL
jgi:hypothetical protein